VVGGTATGDAAPAAADADTFAQVACVDALVSYVSESPYEGQRLGVIAPGLLRHVGDIGHLAALVAAPKVVFAGGRRPDGAVATAADIVAAFRGVPSGRQPQLMPADELVDALSR
jgi:hypothetical protein